MDLLDLATHLTIHDGAVRYLVCGPGVGSEEGRFRLVGAGPVPPGAFCLIERTDAGEEAEGGADVLYTPLHSIAACPRDAGQCHCPGASWLLGRLGS